MGNRWYGNGKSFFILGLLCLLSTEEGQLAFCGGFREIPAVRLFAVGHDTILVLLSRLFLGFLPCCIAHVTSVALVTVWLSFTELVVGAPARRGRSRSMVRMRGSGRCAEVHGVFWAFIDSLIFKR